MTGRHLTITLQPDWKVFWRAAAKVAKPDTHQGEVLSFETPARDDEATGACDRPVTERCGSRIAQLRLTDLMKEVSSHDLASADQ